MDRGGTVGGAERGRLQRDAQDRLWHVPGGLVSGPVAAAQRHADVDARRRRRPAAVFPAAARTHARAATPVDVGLRRGQRVRAGVRGAVPRPSSGGGGGAGVRDHAVSGRGKPERRGQEAGLLLYKGRVRVRLLVGPGRDEDVLKSPTTETTTTTTAETETGRRARVLSTTG